MAELSLTEEDAFVFHNFASTKLRRDIAILGFLHEKILNECHPGVIALLPFAPPSPHWHSKQLFSPIDECVGRHAMFFRSLWGSVLVYNRLPQSFVDITSVTGFPKALTHLAKCRCQAGDPHWRNSFHTESEVWKTRTRMD